MTGETNPRGHRFKHLYRKDRTMNASFHKTALLSAIALILLLLAAAAELVSAQQPRGGDPCMRDNETFFRVHASLYQTFLIEKQRLENDRRGQNARSSSVLDLLIGGMAQSTAQTTLRNTFETCPASVERIIRGASPFSNSQNLSDLLMNALVLQDPNIRRNASDMTSSEFRRWLEREYHLWLRGVR